MRIVNVPKALRDRLGEEATQALVDLLNAATDQTQADTLALSEERYERRLSEEASKFGTRVTEETAKLDRRVTEEAGRLDNRITEEAAKLDRRITEEVARLRTQISDVRADLIRWMFVFWVGQVGVLLGILFAFFRR